jgi:polyribonucleotide nucleotidyltransferase
MFDIIVKTAEWQNRELTLETGKIARKSDGAVIVKMGDTRILCTATYSDTTKKGIDFFPLTVNYSEKYYASGRYPGGFFKRESKATERETLISRFIDRPIRPLFPSDYYNEVNIICTVLSYDHDTQPDILALIGSVAALNISSIPFNHNLGAIKISGVNGKFVTHPTSKNLLEESINLTIAGTRDTILMIESSAKEVKEESFIEALNYAHANMQPVIDLIEEFSKEVGKKNTNL